MIYFNANKKKLIILKINGVNFFKIYKNIILITFSQYLSAYLIIYFVIQEYEFSTLLFTFLVSMLLDLICIVTSISFLEKKDKRGVLEGG
ncbi:MAG: DUF1430 domain-containing protein [Lactococcus cremoris]|nr:hypothetical protein FM106_23945 [Brachybacterium faecium]